jgi:hypothetical protein
MMDSPFEERSSDKNRNTGEWVESAFQTAAQVAGEEARHSRKKSTKVVEGRESFMKGRHRYGGAGIMGRVAIGLARWSARGGRKFRRASRASAKDAKLNKVFRESGSLEERKLNERTRRKAF